MKRATFDIFCKGNEVIQKTGLISKHFGIDKRNDYYIITHLASGWKVANKYYAKSAREIVYNLEKMDVDWSKITPISLKKHPLHENMRAIIMWYL